MDVKLFQLIRLLREIYGTAFWWRLLSKVLYQNQDHVRELL